jgi:hypothetical protein
MAAEQNINPQDYELLSAYIDGELTDDERISLEQRLAEDSFLQHELNSLRSTVSLIHTLQPMTAPRDFTLTEAMVSSPKVIPFKPRRRMRTEYLSFVASILLMLFGVMFMLNETNTMQSFSTEMSAPSQSDTASEKIANAPTELPSDADSQAERVIEEPVILGANAVDEAEEVPAESNTAMNQQAPSPPLDDEHRQEEFGSDNAEAASDDMLFSVETSSSVEGIVADGETMDDSVASETQLLDSITEEDTVAQDAPAPSAGAGFADMEALSETTTTNDENPDSGGARDDNLEESDSDDTGEEVGRIMSPPTEIPPSPQSPSLIRDREQSPSSQTLDNNLIGMGSLSLGLLLLMASIYFIRRNRS